MKMNINLRYLLILIVGLSTFSACKKYEDNPYIFPMRTKEARVVNSWSYELVLRNGLDVTTGMVTDSEDEITISDKEQLLLTYDDPAPLTGATEIWDLTRLQHRNLWWIKNTADDNHIEYRLTPSINTGGGLF